MQKENPNNSERDLRIERAAAVKEAMEHKGVKILFEEYAKMKVEALRNLLDESIASESLELRQKIHNQICDWLKIPESIISEGEKAVMEMKAEEDRPETFIKRNIPFLGRRT
jgi:putative heme iron utilization protein